MWNLINPTSNLSITTTINDPNSPRSWKSFRTGPSSLHTADSESPVLEYSPTIPDGTPSAQPSISRRDRRHLLTRIAFQHVSIFLAASVPIVLLVIIATTPTRWNSISYARSLSFTHCNYDGAFTPYDHRTSSLWKPSSFFQINVFWGHMKFSLAKFLDVGFDLVVGRGLQAVLALLTYKVSSKVLTKLMEGSTVSYQTFEALAFVTPSLAKTGNLLSELLMNRGLQARATIMTLILSSVFVLAFPTLTSAMTGYSNNMDAYFQGRDGQNASWSDVHTVQFTIHDAQRLGAPGPLFVSAAIDCLFLGPGMAPTGNSSGLIYRRNDDGDQDDEHEQLWAAVPPSCNSFWRTVQYVSKYGIGTSTKTASEFYLGQKVIELEAPTLNISTSYDFESVQTLAKALNNSLDSIRTSRSMLKSVSGSAIRPNATFILNDQTYNFEYVMTHTFCKASDSHNWGFSFLFLFITALLLVFWAIAMYALWLDTYLHSQIDQEGRSMGTYRASCDLVQALKQDSSVDTVTDAMSEGDIRQLVKRRKRRGMPFESGGLTYRHLYPDGKKTRWKAFRAWWISGGRVKDVRTAQAEEKGRGRSQEANSPISGTTVWSASVAPGTAVSTEDAVFQFRNDLGDRTWPGP